MSMSVKVVYCIDLVVMIRGVRSYLTLVRQIFVVKEAAKLLVTNSVQSTLSMRSMLLLGGLGTCPPGKF